MDEADQNRSTEGNVLRKMLSFILPTFLSSLSRQFYNITGSLIADNPIGSTTLAAVGSSASTTMLLVGFINGAFLGVGVVIARSYGADDRENLFRALHTTTALGAAARPVLTAVGVLLTPQILRRMGTPDDVIGNSIAYFRVYSLGSSAVVLYSMCASILQSMGDSHSPMKYLILASSTNVVLNLLLVVVFRWGVASVALAAIPSQTLGALLTFCKLTHTGYSYRLSWWQVYFYGDMFRQVIYLGIPSGIQNSVISLANVIVQANINAFGSAAMAGCGAYSKIESFAFLPAPCFSMTLVTSTGQNIGARRYDRVRFGIRFELLCSPLLAEAIGLGTFAFSPLLIAAFNSNPEVVTYGMADARTISLFYFLLAFFHCCAGILRGIGRSIIPMATMLTTWCILRIVYIIAVTHFIPDIRMIYWAYPLTWFLGGLLFTVRLLRPRFPSDAVLETYK